MKTDKTMARDINFFVCNDLPLVDKLLSVHITIFEWDKGNQGYQKVGCQKTGAPVG